MSEYGFKAIQANLNLTDWRALANGLLDLCEQQSVGVIARTPLCFVFLTGAHSPDEKFEPGDHRIGWPSDQIEHWTRTAKMFAPCFLNVKGATPTQSALRFCLSYPSVSTIIPGMLTAKPVEQNALASRVGPFSAEELERARKVYADNVFFVSG